MSAPDQGDSIAAAVQQHLDRYADDVRAVTGDRSVADVLCPEIVLSPEAWGGLQALIKHPPPPNALLRHLMNPEAKQRFFAALETNDTVYPDGFDKDPF